MYIYFKHVLKISQKLDEKTRFPLQLFVENHYIFIENTSFFEELTSQKVLTWEN